jgi:hypothetical protein
VRLYLKAKYTNRISPLRRESMSDLGIYRARLSDEKSAQPRGSNPED